MPGKLKRRVDCENLAKREDDVWAVVSQGWGRERCAQELGVTTIGFRTFVASTPERQARFKEAKKLAAENFADRGRTTLEAAQPSEANIAKARADYYRWLAKVNDREQFGDGPQIAVQINVHELFVQGLRNANKGVGWDGNGSPSE